MQNDPSKPLFLASGGEMGARVSRHDWSATPLGPIASWPASLRIAASMVLSSRFPSCLVWGPELISIYNDAFVPILGAKPDALGCPFDEIWREAWSLIGPIAERAYAGEATFIEDYPLVVHRYGRAEMANFTFCYSPVRDENGNVAGMIDTVIETTARVGAEKAQADALRLTEEALRQSQKMEAIGQLTGGVAHDFNNLLTGISGSLDFLSQRLAQGRTDDLARHIAVAKGGADKAAILTRRLLNFSRRHPLERTAVDINHVIADMEALITRSAGAAITLDVDCAAGLWPVWVDAHQLENALLNLCLNARDALYASGTLRIETSNVTLGAEDARERNLEPGDHVRLRVSDTGCGMTPETMRRMFEPFYTTKPAERGTGLGLALVHDFVRQSGGHIQVRSQPDLGTDIDLYFPRHGGARIQVAADTASVSPSRVLQGRTILLAEDDPAVREITAEVLKEIGFDVIEATDGASALKHLTTQARIDLLVCDLALPGGVNGRRVAETGKTLRPEMKVLFITGYGETAEGNNAPATGAPVLLKPFTLEDLASQVHALMR
ncbi:MULTISPECIES: ATP-binding protein [Achromobacter]|uniref:histidine kinase n=1 Tax=Achromobacter animicus TaxID=1389935 RepID=A0A6S6ZMA0_9BURK|nr:MULTISPECIES: ATP-binding protein [Achromobacter]CAB3685390.1 Sensor histidine kinase RcsC [Achromobacter animicus]